MSDIESTLVGNHLLIKQKCYRNIRYGKYRFIKSLGMGAKNQLSPKIGIKTIAPGASVINIPND